MRRIPPMTYVRCTGCLCLGLAALTATKTISAQDSEGCRVTVETQNRNRVITGIVHEECGPGHSPPWGNWGVISNHSRKVNGFQFPGWLVSDGKRQWNSCTDVYTAPRFFHPRGSGRQESMDVANHGAYQRIFANTCPYTEAESESYVDQGCSGNNTTVLESRRNYMDLYELDGGGIFGGTDDFVTKLRFPDASATLQNCTDGGCDTVTTRWERQRSSSRPVTGVRAEFRLKVTSTSFGSCESFD